MELQVFLFEAGKFDELARHVCPCWEAQSYGQEWDERTQTCHEAVQSRSFCATILRDSRAKIANVPATNRAE